jgi:outer membrane protein assembly factor BamB
MFPHRSMPFVISVSRIIFLAVLVFGLAVSMPMFAAAESVWDRFRGPNGSGIGMADLPNPLKESDIVWKSKLPGNGHSSPVFAGNRVFVTSGEKLSDTEAVRHVVCLDAKTGRELWRKTYPGDAFRQHADNGYGSLTPAVDAERLYIWWAGPKGSKVVALANSDGSEVWKAELGPYEFQHGAGTSPIVVNGLVIIDFSQERDDGVGSFVLALDAKNGAVKWKTARPCTRASTSTPCVFQPGYGGDPQVIVVSQTAGMTALNLFTGAKEWELPDAFSKRCVASPFVTKNGLVIGQCGQGTQDSLISVVEPPKSADEKPVKRLEIIRTGGYVPTPLAAGSLLYLLKENGLTTAIRLPGGEQVWSERVQASFYGSLIETSGRLYAMTRRGELVVLAAGEKFQEIQRLALGEGSFATPALHDGRMYLRTLTQLVCIGRP